MADAAGNSPPPPADLDEIPPHEYETYYFRRNSRDFPLHRLPLALRDDYRTAELPTVLPVDGRDMERRTVQHNIAYLALNHKHYFGPFIECLTPPRNKLVVDVGSANGKWIEDVSEELSHIPRFHGVEIVPRSPTYIDNVYPEVYDFQEEGLHHGPATVDVVHARFQSFHILDWSAFLLDVAKVLKPGGLFMSGEFDLHLEYVNGRWPATDHLYTQVSSLMHQRGYSPNIANPNLSDPSAFTLQRLLQRDLVDEHNVPLFRDYESRTVSIPVGRTPVISDELGLTPHDQLELSVLAMEYLKRLSSSLKPFLMSNGSPEVAVNGLVEAHRHELDQQNAKVTYRMTWAQRR